MGVTVCSSAIITGENQFDLIKALMKEVPKAWFSYVKSILFRIVDHTSALHHVACCEGYLRLMRLETKRQMENNIVPRYESFVAEKCNLNRESSFFFNTIRKAEIYQLNKICFTKERTSEDTVLAPIGKLLSSYQTFFNCAIRDQYVLNTAYNKFVPVKDIDLYMFVWVFHLAPALTLNVTIIKFKTPTVNPSTGRCKRGHLIFQQSQNVWAFCGKISNSYIYSASSKNKIMIETKSCSYSNLLSQFAVSDKNLIKTVNKLLIYDCALNSSNEHIIQSKILLVTYYMRVAILNRLILRAYRDLDLDYLRVYDGPRLFYKLMRPNKNTYVVSTFQCVVQVVVQNWTAILDIDYYTSKQQQNMTKTLKINRDPLLLQIPTEQCIGIICLYTVNYSTPYTNKHLTVNVHSIMYGGINADCPCKYRGLSVMEFNGDSYITVKTMCGVLKETPASDMHIYLTHAPIVIIMYWYKGLSSITVNLSVSLSSCDVIRLDPCKLQHSCRKGPVSCLFYLRRSTKGTGVSLYLLGKSLGVEIGWRLKSASHTQCFILYFTSPSLEIESCRIKVTAVNDDTEESVEVKQTTRGFLETVDWTRHLSPLLAGCRHTCLRPTLDLWLEVTGYAREFCRHSPKGRNLTCKSSTCSDLIYSSKDLKENEFNLYVRTKAPLLDAHSISFQFVQHHEESWVAIMTNVTVLPNRTTDMILRVRSWVLLV